MDAGVVVASLTNQEILELKHISLSVLEVLGRYPVFSAPQVRESFTVTSRESAPCKSLYRHLRISGVA